MNRYKNTRGVYETTISFWCWCSIYHIAFRLDHYCTKSEGAWLYHIVNARPTTIGSFAPFTALAVAAEATKLLRIGSYVFCNEYRHPVILAREAATLDLLSEGRFELGLGAGVGPYEAQRMGIPFANAGVRVGHLEEALQLIKQLFTEETVNFNGKYYTVTEMKGNIPPVQKPHMPILVAGGGERMLKLAAREADIIAIGSKITAQGVDPTDATLEQKIAWIKEASGKRFADLELSQTVYDLVITDSKATVSHQGPPIPKRQVILRRPLPNSLSSANATVFPIFRSLKDKWRILPR